MEVLDTDISDVQSGLKTVSIGVEAMRRLDVVNQTVADLRVFFSFKKVFSVLTNCTEWFEKVGMSKQAYNLGSKKVLCF